MPALRLKSETELWSSDYSFELSDNPRQNSKKRGPLQKGRPFASATSSLSEKFLRKSTTPACPPPSPPPPPPKVRLKLLAHGVTLVAEYLCVREDTDIVDTKPASDVIAGAVARAASQGTIHPLDTLKVQLQSGTGKKLKPALSKISQLVPPSGAAGKATVNTGKAVQKALPKIAGLYRGVFGAASGAGIAIGAYFAFYGAATNVLARKTPLPPPSIAFVSGAIAAAGGSIVKVPLAVCIRSVQAGVYPNVFKAAADITQAAGPRGLFTGYLPTLMEDVPDMAFKFASYETLRSLHKQIFSRSATVQEDFAMGAVSGAFAAAATTPLDVIKTTMMCTAASRPNMLSASRQIMQEGGPNFFFRGIGARALSNGINSAVFFCFFEALRSSFARRKEQAMARSLAIQRARDGPDNLVHTRGMYSDSDLPGVGDLQPASTSLAIPLKHSAKP